MSYVNSVTVYPSQATVTKGQWYYGAWASISSDCPECAEVEWYSNSPSIASVNKTTGYIYGVSTGKTRIYAIAKDDDSKKDYIEVTVTAPVSVTGVSVCPTNLTMNVGDIDYLCETVYPSNATNKAVTWCSSDESIAEVNTYNGSVLAKKAGVVTITACTVDGEYSASCTVTVFIDTVTIKKDGLFNKVVFSKSGKVWRCINYDMIYNEDNSNNSILIQRSNHNFYTYYDENDMLNSNTTPKEYTNDEIKLLYAIDPYGVADYVRRYAEKEYIGLRASLQYKDGVFKLLFNKEPRYFVQLPNGKWDVTENKSDINNVISESESYFGMHQSYDFLRVLVNAIDFATAVLCTIIPNDATDTIIEVGGTLLKVGILYHNEEYQMAFEEVVSLAGNLLPDTKEKLIESVFDVLSVFTSFNELIESLETKPRYYCDILDYCINKVDYNVILELENGEKMKLKDIKESVA